MDVFSILLVFVLNSILFSYVILYELIDNMFVELTNKFESTFRNYLIFKQIVVGPVFEEFYFRVMFFYLQQRINPGGSTFLFVLMNGLVFAISHFDNNKANFFFRTIFGIYAAYIMTLTKNFWSCFLLHAYCNFLGPP